MIKWLLVVALSTGEQFNNEYETQQECEVKGLELFKEYKKQNNDVKIDIYCAKVKLKGSYSI
jgi:hypothetical protein